MDLNSFSLIIEKVTRTDAGNYFGELGVMETEGASKMNYMQTIDMGIRLEVYGKHHVYACIIHTVLYKLLGLYIFVTWFCRIVSRCKTKN